MLPRSRSSFRRATRSATSRAACVRSLAQRGVDAEVIVVDDGSTDATGAILRAPGSASFRPCRSSPAKPLPDGWVGKPWACTQGARRGARRVAAVHRCRQPARSRMPSASTLAFARAHGADALSIMTGQELGTLAEAALLPSILQMIVFAAACSPSSTIRAPGSRAGERTIHLLVSRRAYDALGGHAALRGELVEDIEFARRLKRDGRFRLLLAEGTHLVRVRMYRSFRELWAGFTKNVYLGARGDVRRSPAASLFCAALVDRSAAARRRCAAARAPAPKLPRRRRRPRRSIAVAARHVRSVRRMPRRLAVFAPLGIADARRDRAQLDAPGARSGPASTGADDAIPRALRRSSGPGT